ncbi:MAG: hypothetical protein C0504_06255 [Candidatus Solibacter sp.]|nr:hypothetical protein [Candidatus Solibacter sp.]
MTDDQHWGSFPFLRVLRPEPGESVEGAIIATYSVDLVVVAAALLALVELDDDRGSGSKVDFANAFDRLHGRFSVVCQRGRTISPGRNVLVLKLMDRFLKEVDADERQYAWHPKVALVWLRDQAGALRWRLWLGSRNLTKSTAWELGLTLTSVEKGGQSIPGIARLGEVVGEKAGLAEWDGTRLRRELERVRWAVPRGIAVKDIHFFDVGETHTLPAEPAGLKRLVVVSPYLDGAFIGSLGRWGDVNCERILVSTLPELMKLSQQKSAPLSNFALGLRYLDAPCEIEADLDVASPADTPPGTDEEPESRALHAKLIYAEHRGGRTLWVGSANATGRAWSGPNSEVIACLSADADVAKGLNAFLNAETSIVDAELLAAVEAQDCEQERLDTIRCELAATWNLKQERRSGELWLCGDYDPHVLADDLQVRVAALGGPWVDWPAKSAAEHLHCAGLAHETELVVVFLRIGTRETQWVQLARITGFQPAERDRKLLAQYLDARTFLAWIRSLLDQSICGEGGGDWDGDQRTPHPVRRNGSDPDVAAWAPSLEQALKAWLRDPDQLRQVDDLITRYLDSIHQAQISETPDPESRALGEIRRVWPVVRRELIPDRTERSRR